MEPTLSLFEHLSLTCRRIILEDLRVDMQIGAHAEEHGHTQPVLVTVEAWVPLKYSTARGDNLDEVYSYSDLSLIIADIVSRGHIRLQETFGDALLDRVMADERVAAARVKTAKLHACVGAKAVAVETFRLRR